MPRITIFIGRFQWCAKTPVLIRFFATCALRTKSLNLIANLLAGPIEARQDYDHAIHARTLSARRHKIGQSRSERSSKPKLTSLHHRTYYVRRLCCTNHVLRSFEINNVCVCHYFECCVRRCTLGAKTSYSLLIMQRYLL